METMLYVESMSTGVIDGLELQERFVEPMVTRNVTNLNQRLRSVAAEKGGNTSQIFQKAKEDTKAMEIIRSPNIKVAYVVFRMEVDVILGSDLAWNWKVQKVIAAAIIWIDSLQTCFAVQLARSRHVN